MNLTHWEVIPRQPYLPSEAYQHRAFNKSVIATHENPYKNVILHQMVPENQEKTKQSLLPGHKIDLLVVKANLVCFPVDLNEVVHLFRKDADTRIAELSKGPDGLFLKLNHVLAHLLPAVL